jgi:hypothetical protein
VQAAERQLKIVVMVIALVAASGAAPAFAKEVRAHSMHGPARASSPKANAIKAAKSESHTPRATGAESGAAPANSNRPETANTPAAIARRPGFGPEKGRELQPRAGIAAPGNPPPHRALTPPNLTTRNAIGATVGPASVGISNPAGNSAKTKGTLGEPIAQPQRPIVNASSAGQSRIGGAGLIRPALAPSGLGGPAKTVAGINGTAMRPKH